MTKKRRIARRDDWGKLKHTAFFAPRVDVVPIVGVDCRRKADPTASGRPVLWQCAPKRWAATETPGPGPFLLRQVLDDAVAKRGEVPGYVPPRHPGLSDRLLADWSARMRKQARELTKQQERRFPALPRIKPKIFKWPDNPMLGTGCREEYQAQRRAELRSLVEAYGGTATYCPSEWTSRELAAMVPVPKKKVGRPRKFPDRVMDDAERQREKYWRDKEKKLRRIVEAPPLSPSEPRGEHVPHSLTERTNENVENMESPQPQGRKE